MAGATPAGFRLWRREPSLSSVRPVPVPGWTGTATTLVDHVLGQGYNGHNVSTVGQKNPADTWREDAPWSGAFACE